MLLALPAARAHLMPAGQGGVRVDADSVFAIVSIPVSAFKGFDDDGDGRMSLDEINKHREALLAQAAKLMEFRNAGATPTLVFEDLLIPHLHEPGAPPVATDVIAMQRWRWPGPITALSFRAPWLGKDAATLTVRATDGKRTEVLTLTAQCARQQFFREPPSASRPPSGRCPR
ncbi:hypothetical protein [Caenimonas aquaedulcis]|uniref:EF-hand domain-containing protein n=1 Tax=Caenimonas aquaedulcis TaxID=2793270 RepID=A0A931H5T5_9BURK|nr:hypothetical protein [Caenimonas aquaedulcis]MBG9389185.1 hypothetical protein [Caenimonas aquaedulcis]